MMLNNPIEARLAHLESQLNALAESLLDSDAEKTLACSREIYEVAHALSSVVDEVGGAPPKWLRQRLQALAQVFTVVRAQLVRRQAYVDQSLKLLMPAAQSATYGNLGRYGAGGRASGAMRAFSA